MTRNRHFVVEPGMGSRYSHDDVIEWKHFPCYWPFVWGIHKSPVNSPHKGQWRGALMFSLIGGLNKRLSKQSWGCWFEMLSRSLWRHCNAFILVAFVVKRMSSGSIPSSLAHWGRGKMAAILQTAFSNAFSWTKICELRLKFHWSLFPMFQLTICQYRF